MFLNPGRGKTAIMLFAFKILKSIGVADTMLIVSTKRVIHKVWPDEIDKWEGLGHLTYSIMHGGKKESGFDTEADIYATTYDTFPVIAKRLKYSDKHKFDVLCIDESSKYRNTNTQRFKKLKPHLGKFKRRYVMTGTPMPRSLMNVFGQVFILDFGERLSQFITNFRSNYFHRCGYEGEEWCVNSGSFAKVAKKIKDIVIAIDDKTVSVPTDFVIRKLALDDKSTRIYRKIEKEFIAELTSGTVLINNAADKSNKMRQFVGGCVYLEAGKPAYDLMNTVKMDDLEDLIEELQGSPIFVSYWYKHEAIELQKRFPKAEFIKSGTSDRKANDIIDRWNSGFIEILFGQPGSVAHGLNMQEGTCRDVYEYSIPSDTELYIQFYQRIARQGNKMGSVVVHHPIIENTYDEVILASTKAKDRSQRGFLKLLKDYYLKGERNVIEDNIVELHEEFITKNMEEKLPKYNFKSIWKLVGKWNLETLNSYVYMLTNENGLGDRSDLLIKAKEVVQHVLDYTKEIKMANVSKFATKKSSKKSVKKSVKKKAKSVKKQPAKAAKAVKTVTKGKRSLVSKKAAGKGAATAQRGKITVGSTEAQSGIHAQIQAVANKKPVPFETFVANVSKKIDHKYSKDLKWVKRYVAGGVREGYLKESS